MFEINHVEYNGIITIDHLSIDEGSFTAIIGESGGGKSTFLRMLNKMLSPSKGSILFKGAPLEEYDSVGLRRQVLYLKQKPYMFMGSVKDNLLIGLKYQHKEYPTDDMLLKMLERVHLAVSLHQDARTLSGGEAQRVALARLLLLEGDVYLFDEPSSALDEKSEMKVLTSVFDWLKSKNKTLIMVTHSKHVASTHTDRILRISSGTIKEDPHEW